MMKVLIALLAGVVAVACRSGPRVFYAENEGLRIAEQPPVFRPARLVSDGLRSANRGQLVVRVQVSRQASEASVVLHPVAAGQSAVQQSTGRTGVTEFSPLIPGEYAVTARRVGLRPQTVRVVVAGGFADTITFGLGQP